MAIVNTWIIADCEHDIATGGINAVHWRATAEETLGDDIYTASLYGVINLTPDPSSADFVAYANVTEAMVRAWVWGSVDQAEIEARLAANINGQKNPIKANGLPWSLMEN